MVDNFNSDNNVIDSEGGKLYIETDWKAPNKRVVTVDVTNPKPANWKDLIPETENVLTPSVAGGFIFANYMKDAVSLIRQYDYSGKLVREIQLPGLGTAGGFSGKKTDKTVYYSFTNYITPGTIYALETQSGNRRFT